MEKATPIAHQQWLWLNQSERHEPARIFLPVMWEEPSGPGCFSNFRDSNYIAVSNSPSLFFSFPKEAFPDFCLKHTARFFQYLQMSRFFENIHDRILLGTPIFCNRSTCSACSFSSSVGINDSAQPADQSLLVSQCLIKG